MKSIQMLPQLPLQQLCKQQNEDKMRNKTKIPILAMLHQRNLENLRLLSQLW